MSAASDPIAELLSMKKSGEITAEEFRLASEYVRRLVEKRAPAPIAQWKMAVAAVVAPFIYVGLLIVCGHFSI